MPGAGKKRGKSDKKNQPAPAQDEQSPVDQPSGGYDGAPAGSPSRGRQPSASVPSGSREASAPAADAGAQPLRDPARDYPRVLNRNVDFPGNAYNLISEVSH